MNAKGCSKNYISETHAKLKFHKTHFHDVLFITVHSSSNFEHHVKDGRVLARFECTINFEGYPTLWQSGDIWKQLD